MTPLKVKQAIAYQTNGVSTVTVKSYTGTGMAGSNNKTRITYTKAPKFILITANHGGSIYDYYMITGPLCLIYGQTSTIVVQFSTGFSGNSAWTLNVTWGTSYVEFWTTAVVSDNSSLYTTIQFNAKGIEYKVCLIE